MALTARESTQYSLAFGAIPDGVPAGFLGPC